MNKIAFVFKKTICSYLCIFVVILGVITSCPANAAAKLIKPNHNTVQIDFRERQDYKSRSNSNIEVMIGGKLNTGESNVLGILGILLLIAIVASAAGKL